jgi:hypothetical protein
LAFGSNNQISNDFTGDHFFVTLNIVLLLFFNSTIFFMNSFLVLVPASYIFLKSNALNILGTVAFKTNLLLLLLTFFIL